LLIVAGLSLRNLHPRVWDAEGAYYLPALRAVMASYAEFHTNPTRRKQAMEQGLHAHLGIPAAVRVYLDNGAFYFMRAGGEVPRDAYDEFVREARPDWYPIPQDYIPTPGMTDAEQLHCLTRTMDVNRQYHLDGYVPVIHVGRHLGQYLAELHADDYLRVKPIVGLGAMVPNLLRAPKAMAYGDVLEQVRQTRAQMQARQMHVFGVGGTATLHVAALLGVDSVDSSGWRNRAARGIVQLPGRGDRVVANLGNWRGRDASEIEALALTACPCPACGASGLSGLQMNGLAGFCNRATHNLWVLLQEAEEIAAHQAAGDYATWYDQHLDNSVYLPLVRQLLAMAK
jgi:7-cyano-7-deazaguanine tRNA-ribosyltransferase